MKRFTLRLDREDKRDLIYQTKNQVLPSFVDLRSHCSAVENQGEIGSCTANALVGQLEFLEKKGDGELVDLSRLFVYYNERFVENHASEDSGASLRDGVKVLKDYGVCPEVVWPYEEKLLFIKPDRLAYQRAKDHRITKYERLKSLTDMKDCLASGLPFVFGVQVFQSIMSDVVRQTGFIPLPKPNEVKLGGHALMAVGYDDDEKQLLIRNSWGATWGKNGYGWLPYGYFQGGLAMDVWTIFK